MTSTPPAPPNQRTCRHCGEAFTPDVHNHHRQRFCFKPECRKASKAASQQTWLTKNPEHFHGSENVLRVQQWRQVNPGYARRSRKTSTPAPIQKQQIPNEPASSPPAEPLQDFVPPLQDSVYLNPLIIGLIAHVFGCALQDDVARNMHHLINRGKEIMATRTSET